MIFCVFEFCKTLSVTGIVSCQLKTFSKGHLTSENISVLIFSHHSV